MCVLYLLRDCFCPPFPFSNSIQFDSRVSEPPLHASESVPASFAADVVDVTDAHQKRKRYSSGSFNGFAMRQRALVVVASRSDSYERLQTEPRLVHIAQHPLSLPPIPRAQFKAVIEGPVT